MFFSYVFFFSSRRRHTRSLCDWSSDVCSSDLGDLVERSPATARLPGLKAGERSTRSPPGARCTMSPVSARRTRSQWSLKRSEERRVGKEGSSRGRTEEWKKKEGMEKNGAHEQ